MFSKYIRIPSGRPDEGQALTEYALIIGFIALVCVASVTAIGTRVNAMLQGIPGAL